MKLAEFSGSVGYDAVLVKRPAFLREDQIRETLTFFQAVADRSPLPVILYSIPSARLSIEAIGELSSHPNVIGLADEDASRERVEQIRSVTSEVQREVTVTTVFAAVTGRMLAVKEQEGAATFVSAESLGGGAAVAKAPPKPAIKTRTKAVGFQILTASSAQMLAGLRAGATGALPGFAACAPQACYEVYAAWKDDDQPLAEEKQARVAPAIAKVEIRAGRSWCSLRQRTDRLLRWSTQASSASSYRGSEERRGSSDGWDPELTPSPPVSFCAKSSRRLDIACYFGIGLCFFLLIP